MTMGTPDTVRGICPSCTKEFLIQTKVLGNNSMSDIQQGDKVNFNLDLELKEPCEHCGSTIIALIKATTTTLGENILSSFMVGKGKTVERHFGEVEYR